MLANLVIYSVFTLLSYIPRVAANNFFAIHFSILFVVTCIVIAAAVIYEYLVRYKLNSPQVLSKMNTFRPTEELCRDLYELRFTSEDIITSVFGPKHPGDYALDGGQEKEDSPVMSPGTNMRKNSIVQIHMEEGNSPAVLKDETSAASRVYI
ncbi:hypothetical protein AKO1_002358 [Acrasis kona]|uniref:Uncharacterized protein n=1 Tax=Acrasis kona TaxID=1008807 RepID=A0AAW2YV56_9EUKA